MNRTRGLTGAFVSVLLGVLIVTVTASLYASGVAPVPDRFANAPIVVASPSVVSPDPFPASRPWSSATASALAEELREVPGVERVVLERAFYAQLVLDGAVVVSPIQDNAGYGWSSVEISSARLVDGAPPLRTGQVAVDRSAGLSVGATVTILTATGPAPYTVSGLLDGPGLFLSDVDAQRLSPGVRAIGLRGDPTETTLEQVKAIVGGDGTVLTGDARGVLEPRADARTRWIGSQALAGISALAAFVAIFVVASTFAFHVNQRRREWALLRVIGALPAQIRGQLHREALVVGTTAAALGVGLGVLIAPWLAPVMVAAGFEPATFAVRWRLWPLVAAFAVGPVMASLGVWAAARRAGRVSPLETLRQASVEGAPMSRTRWIVGGLSAAAGLAAVIGAASTKDTQDMATLSLLGTMTLVIAATVLAPSVVPAFVVMVTWPLSRVRGATVHLVRQAALTAVRRTASTAAPVLLTVTFAVFITGYVQTTAAGYAAARADAVRTGSVLVPDGTPGLSDAAVASAPGVVLLETPVYLGDRTYAALGVDPATFVDQNRRLLVTSGELADLDGDSMAATVAAVGQHGWRLGGTVTLTMADGEAVGLRLAAILSDRSVPADVLLTRDTVRAHDPSALTSVVYLTGPAPAAVGARTVDIVTWAGEADAEEDRLVWLFTLLLVAVSAGYGAIAVANTLLMAATSRRRDLLVLWRSGATVRQVCLTVAGEAALSVGIGSVLGAAVAAIALIGGMASLRERAGAPVDLVVSWPTVAGVVATCLVLAVAASVLPTHRALRRR